MRLIITAFSRRACFSTAARAHIRGSLRVRRNAAACLLNVALQQRGERVITQRRAASRMNVISK